MSVLRAFYDAYGRIHGAGAIRNFDEVEQALRSGGYLDRVLKAAWPTLAPDRLVGRLLTSKAVLAEAAEGILDPAEQKLLLRRGADWSDGDVALLDEARSLLDAAPHVYGHVIVDEAQDLTPMQLRMIARRSRDGSLTILGDVAQATGAIQYRRWEELLPYLSHGDEAAVEELRHSYRVPREIMEVALPLLDTIAPELAPPISYRTGADPPTVRRVPEEHLLAAAFEEARRAGSARRPARGDRPRRARRRRAGGRSLGRDPAARAARGEGTGVRPRGRPRAGADRGARTGPARALRRADAPDEDARRRARARPAGGPQAAAVSCSRFPEGSCVSLPPTLAAASSTATPSGSTIVNERRRAVPSGA